MNTIRTARIQVLLDRTELTPAAVHALRKLGVEIELGRFDRPDRTRTTTAIEARLIVTADANELRSERLSTLLACCAGEPCATLVLSMRELNGSGAIDPALTDHGISFVYNPTEEELTAQLAVMCGMRGPIATMRRELVELRRREADYCARLSRVDDERRLAGLVQRDLLPAKLPEIHQGELSVLYHPADEVSGDLYEAIRLDEDHVAISVLDATGHGLAAALLAAYGKKSLQGAHAINGVSCLVEPDEILLRMNQDLLEANLSECHFVSAISAIYNEQTREIRFARGGGCYPILIRAGQPPQTIRSDGPIVGVDGDAQFETVCVQLRPGDSLLLHSDGLNEALQAADEPTEHEGLADTDAFRRIVEESPETPLEAIERRLHWMDAASPKRDDVTVIALHLHARMADVTTRQPARDSNAAACV